MDGDNSPRGQNRLSDVAPPHKDVAPQGCGPAPQGSKWEKEEQLSHKLPAGNCNNRSHGSCPASFRGHPKLS